MADIDISNIAGYGTIRWKENWPLELRLIII